jgi:hypothetical protein
MTQFADDVLIEKMATSLNMGDTLFKNIQINAGFRFNRSDDRLVKRSARSYYSPKSGRCFTTGINTAVWRAD